MNFLDFKNQYQKVPVEHYPTNTPEEPLVSVCVQTYQQADYIEDCLKGILMQEADFPIEILLGEDASTDGTREICIEYAEKHPEKIRLLLHSRENNIEIGGHPTGRFNFLYNLYNARGKYIAFCEGDDYWTDPLKLQKQIEFLEKNENYGLVHTDNDVYNKETGEFIRAINKKKDRGLDEVQSPLKGMILGYYQIHTLTVLFRSELLKSVDFDKLSKYKMGDLPLWMTMANHTEFYYMDEVTAVYRINKGSASNPVNKFKKMDFQISSKKARLDYARNNNFPKRIIKFVEDWYHRICLRKAFEERSGKKAKKYFGKLHQKKVKDYVFYIGSQNIFFWKFLMNFSNRE